MIFFRIGCFVLLLICLSHLAGHSLLFPHFRLLNNFTGLIPQNETERQLLDLMNHYERKIGGTTITMMNLQDGLSLCYALLFLWAGSLNLYLSYKIPTQVKTLRMVSVFTTGALSIGLIISMLYFFWLPAASFAIAMMLFGIASTKL